MGKLFQESSARKEGAKQDTWLTSVTAALQEYNGPLKHLVVRLVSYDNIPRKQRAFENFVANSLNLKRDPSTVTKLWAIVEPCIKKQEPGNNAGHSTPLPWTSFEEETIEILKRSGGSTTWKLLQANLAKRRKSTHPHEDYESIRTEVLASVPDQYLSDSSNIVSL
jgi:cell growth-regulating nucleolar protein